jgi:hypothetical protein
MMAELHTELNKGVGEAKSAGNRLARLFLSIIWLTMTGLAGVTGCTSLTDLNSRNAVGTQPESSHSTSAGDLVAMSNQAEAKPISLKKAKTDLKQARQKVKLAELKMELSVLEMKLADYHQKIAETMVRKAEIYKQRLRLEADYPKGKGIKTAVIDKLEVLKTKSLDLESDNIKSKAAMAKIDLNIQKLKRKVDLQINQSLSPGIPEKGSAVIR